MILFKLNHETIITICNLPLQWIPKIELYYPDLPQFPIMYVHFLLNDADFIVLINETPTTELIQSLTNEISNRIGFSNQITQQTVIDCCKGNKAYIGIFTDLWKYIEKSYGASIPYGRSLATQNRKAK